MGNLSKQQKMMLLRSRYRCVDDLWTYLTERSMYYMYFMTYISIYSWSHASFPEKYEDAVFVGHFEWTKKRFDVKGCSSKEGAMLAGIEREGVLPKSYRKSTEPGVTPTRSLG